MPNRTIYIRKEDIKNWDSIDDKPEWLHMNLHKGYKVVREREDGSGAIYNVTQEAPKIRPLSEAMKDEEIFGSYNQDNLIISRADDAMFDITTGMRYEATP